MAMKDLCRTCLLPSKSTLPIFGSIQVSNSQFELQILNLLKLFTDISDSPSDGLPENICRSCIEKVHQSYAFKLKFEKSQAFWKQLKEDRNNLEKCISPPNEYEHYSDLDFHLLKTEKKKEHTTIKCEELEQMSLPVVIESGIVNQEMYLVQEVKQEAEIEINVDLEDFNEVEKCPKTDSQRNVCRKTQRNTQYKCTTCSKLFVRKSDLNRHMIIHSDEKPLPCKMCQKNFKYRSSLIYHMKKEHADRYCIDREFDCTLCSKSFASQPNLNRHMIIHSNENPFQCEICLKRFRIKKNLKVHLKIHDDKKFKCPTCSELFRHNSYMRLHMRTHTGEKAFQCELCSKKFAHKNNLTIHMQKIHGEGSTSNFKCVACSKSFSSKSDLKRHAVIHSDEKEFQCEICLKKFTLNRYMKVHMKMVHGDKTTKNFKCSECPKLYSYEHELKWHMRIHTGERPYGCQLCSKKFVYKNYLNIHMRKIHYLKPEGDIKNT